MGFLQALPTKGLCQESTTHMSYFSRLGMQGSWYWRAEEKFNSIASAQNISTFLSYPILAGVPSRERNRPGKAETGNVILKAVSGFKNYL